MLGVAIFFAMMLVSIKRRSIKKKNIKLNFFWPKMACLGQALDPKIAPIKFMWVASLRSLSGNEAHKLFLGIPSEGFWEAGKKFMLKKF